MLRIVLGFALVRLGLRLVKADAVVPGRGQSKLI